MKPYILTYELQIDPKALTVFLQALDALVLSHGGVPGVGVKAKPVKGEGNG